MKIRIILTIIIMILAIGFLIMYSNIQGPLEGSAGIAQLNGSTTDYVVARAIANGAIKNTFLCMCSVVICIIWIPHIYRKFKKSMSSEGEQKKIKDDSE